MFFPESLSVELQLVRFLNIHLQAQIFFALYIDQEVRNEQRTEGYSFPDTHRIDLRYADRLRRFLRGGCNG